MPRLKKPIENPLGKRTKVLLRNFVRERYELKSNSSEEKVLQAWGFAFLDKRGINDAYRALADEYNSSIQTYNDGVLAQRRVERSVKAKARRIAKKTTPKPQTFILTLHKEGIYYKSYYHFELNYRFKIGDVQEWYETTLPMTATNVEEALELYEKRHQ